MKALCIKEGGWVNHITGKPTEKGPSYNEECVITGTDPHGWYLIKGYEFNLNGFRRSFKPSWFIPLSNIDETEMVREYKTEKV